MAPTGGGSKLIGPNTCDITWDNVAQVGYANFQVDPRYTWSCGVNVVAVTIYPAAITTGTVGQRGTIIDSSITGAAAITVSTNVKIVGPSVAGGPQRGVHFMQVGAIQNVKTTYDEVKYGNGVIKYWEGQDGVWYIDKKGASTDPAPWNIGLGDPDGLDSVVQPISDPAANYFPSFTVSFQDAPYCDFLAGATDVRIRYDFRLFLAIGSTAPDPNPIAKNKYKALQEIDWAFDGTGSLLTGAWVGSPGSGDFVPSAWGAVNNTMITDGTTANEHASQISGSASGSTF